MSIIGHEVGDLGRIQARQPYGAAAEPAAEKHPSACDVVHDSRCGKPTLLLEVAGEVAFDDLALRQSKARGSRNRNAADLPQVLEKRRDGLRNPETALARLGAKELLESGLVELVDT
jgi:hypothetical protein